MAKNNDAYLVNFVGKFLEGYALGKQRNMDYKEKLALKEIEQKEKDRKAAEDAKQQEYENALKASRALADADALGRPSQYVDEKGVVHTAQPLAPEQVTAARERIYSAIRGRGVNVPGLPPLPVPAAAMDGVPEMLRRPDAPPPPLPSSGMPAIPSAPEVPPAKIQKYPTFDDAGIQAGAEARRTKAQLSKRYEDAAKPAIASFQAFADARRAYQSAKLAKSQGKSSSAADLDLFMSMVRSQQGNYALSEGDVARAKPGSLPQKWMDWYGMAVNGQLTDRTRDEIFKLSRDAAVARDKDYAQNVEKYFTAETQRELPGTPVSAVVRPIRPVDWDNVIAEYEAEYNANKPAGVYSDPEKERRYQEWKKRNGK